MLKNKKGFTLIELIIVMSVVGLLAITGIIALSSKVTDARNARRKADMAIIIKTMTIQCNDSTGLINCPEVGTTNSAALMTCDDATPSGFPLNRYITISNILDPIENGVGAAALCDSVDGAGTDNPCNYTVTGLIEGTVDQMDPCNPHILFAVEDGNDYYTGCAEGSGIRIGKAGATIDPALTCK